MLESRRATSASRRKAMNGARPVPELRTERRLIVLYMSWAMQSKRAMVEGVILYSRRHRPGWEFLHKQPLGEGSATALRDATDADGIVCDIVPDAEVVREFRERRVPIVVVERPTAALPSVRADNAAIARLAFDHLRGKGFRRLAYFTEYEAWPFDERGAAFSRLVADAGLAAESSPGALWEIPKLAPERRGEIDRWIHALPKPVGVFAGNVEAGARLLLACRRLNIRVPQDVAVIGCDNEELQCNLASPPLSSIEHGMPRVGYEAASLLDSLMNGGPPPSGPVVVEPGGVVERQSTDTLAIEEPSLRAALRYINEHALDGVCVDEVVQAVGSGRRNLEIGFRRRIGHTIQQEILRQQIGHAQHLLVDSEMKMAAIAEACGFSSAVRLQVVFKRVVGLSPGEYRRRYRSL